jgi:hypothetical protein
VRWSGDGRADYASAHECTPKPALRAVTSTRVDAQAKAEKARFRKHAAELELLLWTVWDPIGSGVPLDEYANYVPVIWRLLEAQAGAETVSAELKRICDERISMDAGTNDQTGKVLTAWWYWRFIFPEEFAADSSE